ncbi:MAG: YbaK/EbsC family protein [Capsulimonas sp.]|uniref:YbaK/EbsC family protein n=1 Tax=Capsulimonas sp. TaxID=2494211 RepID=UPI0032646CA9
MSNAQILPEKTAAGCINSRTNVLMHISPGLKLEVFSHSAPVVTCEEAAFSKSRLLDDELKTLLLWTDRGWLIVNTIGSKRISLRAIKKFYKVKQARLASPDEINELNLKRGAVSMLLEPIWSLPTITDPDVFNRENISTNNGTLMGYFIFNPRLLLSAPRMTVASVE